MTVQLMRFLVNKIRQKYLGQCFPWGFSLCTSLAKEGVSNSYRQAIHCLYIVVDKVH